MSAVGRPSVNSDTNEHILAGIVVRRRSFVGSVLACVCVFGKQRTFHIATHGQAHWEGKVRVDLLFGHRQHIKRVAHRVERQNFGKSFETRPKSLWS